MPTPIRLIAFSLFLALLPAPLWAADARESRPFSLQWVPPTSYGANTTTYDQGFSLGWHFGPHWYLGALHRFAGKGESQMGWMMGGGQMAFEQDGLDRSTYERDPQHALELRWTPWDFGLFFSAGWLMLEAQTDRFEFDKRLRILGDNAYRTDLKITIERPTGASLGAGLGYFHAFENGLNLSAGWLLGADHRERTVTIATPNADSTVAEADLEHLRDDVDFRENMFPLGVFHLGVGWSF